MISQSLKVAVLPNPLQKVQTAPMIKSHQNQSGRRSSFAEGGGLFY